MSTLDTYHEHKAALCQTGEALRENVCNMLAEIFEVDDQFVDKGREDWRYDCGNVVLLFEIKGTTNGLKRIYVQQTANHVAIYDDEEGDINGIHGKGVLIIAHLIDDHPLELSNYPGYNEEPVKIAVRDDILIVPMKYFLQLYGAKLLNTLDVDGLKQALIEEVGTLNSERVTGLCKAKV